MIKPSFKNYVGVDISKKTLDVAVLRPGMTDEFLEYKIENTIASLKQLKKSLAMTGVKFNKETLVLMEHMGVYKTHLVNFLMTQRCPVCIENPFRIKRSLGIVRGKSDRIDARRIASYGKLHERTLCIWSNPRKSILILKDLLANRDRLMKAKKALLVPLKDFKLYYSKKDFGTFEMANASSTQGIDCDLQYITNLIKQIIKSDENVAKQIALIQSVPGVGLIVALHLLCYTNEFTLFRKGKQLASYAGVAPFPFQSGESVRGKSKVHPIANKKLKTLLHIAAVANLRSKNELKSYYDRKLAQGKNKMSVLNALRNKIVLRIAAVISRGTPYVKDKEGLGSSSELYYIQSS